MPPRLAGLAVVRSVVVLVVAFVIIALAVLGGPSHAVAQTDSTSVNPDALADASDAWIAANTEQLKGINQFIWSHPEVGLQEYAAADQLTRLLESEGFAIERGVAGMPTAFVATAGAGRPIVGILAEYDALPGMSQAPSPDRTPRSTPEGIDPNDAGHACGHSVFGTASAAAAVAAWRAMQENSVGGTIRLYGTPAEETGIGKIYMARAGLFDDLDAALHWHASDRNRVQYSASKALVSVKYSFRGLSAHASRSPHEGRSALDAVELMNAGVNFLREHLKDDARLHYVITDGGGQPNVVPASAEVWYYLRSNRHTDVEFILERVRDIAQGAALMTSTEVEERIDSDTFELLPNRPLSQLLYEEMQRVGPPQFDDDERAFARQTQAPLRNPPEQSLASEIDPIPAVPWPALASTDVGNVSWRVPTSGINSACYTLGAPGHSWQIVACTGMTIGEKGMLAAARTLASSTVRLMIEPTWLQRSQEDFDLRRSHEAAPYSTLPEEQQAPSSIR